MTSYVKPESYTDADWEMVQGYMRGNSGQVAERKNPAYTHGYLNGQADRRGVPHERATVLQRRAAMIPGITPQAELIAKVSS